MVDVPMVYVDDDFTKHSNGMFVAAAAELVAAARRIKVSVICRAVEVELSEDEIDRAIRAYVDAGDDARLSTFIAACRAQALTNLATALEAIAKAGISTTAERART